MILDHSQMITDPEFGQDVFFGKVLESPENGWQSTFPNDITALAQAAQADPGLYLKGLSDEEFQALSNLASMGQSVKIGKKTISYFNIFARGLGNQALFNVVNASRQMLGMMVRTCGVLSSQFPVLRNIFREEASIAMRVINIIDDIVDSEFFAMALDAIGFIPVVGWIIKIVVDVVKAVTKVVGMFLDEREKLARAMAADQLTIPISATEFSKDADDLVVQQIFDRLRYGQQQSFIEPTYNPMGASGEYLGFTADGVYDDGTWASARSESMSLGWVIHPSPQPGTGFGFVPGSGNISRSLFFPAGVAHAPNSNNLGCAGGAVRDLGSLYQTGQGLLNSWWSMVLRQGPAMFSVNPMKAVNKWENYIYAMLMLGPNVLQGWTCAPTGIPFTDKFYCVDEVMGAQNKNYAGLGDCKRLTRGKTLKLPSDFGRDSHTTLVAYLYRLYFGLKKLGDRDKYYDPDAGQGIPLKGNPKFYEDNLGALWAEPDSVEVGDAVPILALENLHARQVATLQSPYCMYVNGYDTENFAAFKDNKALRDQWEESVTAILNSNDWRRIIPDDVPEGPAKNALIQKIQQAGLDPATFNPPCPPGAPMSHPCRQMPLKAGPSVLGDPEPPVPPPSNDVDPQQFIPGKIAAVPGGGGKKKSGGGAGIAIAAAAVAAVLIAKK